MKIETENNWYLRTVTSARNKIDIWFIHGFAESSLSFNEAFFSGLSTKYNLFAPDFPGFGASPALKGNKDLKGSLSILLTLVNRLSRKRKIAVVAHSLGGILGTWLCRELGPQIIAYINVEGNFTQSDTSFSSRVNRIASAEKAHQMLLALLWERANGSVAYQRYYASVRFADPSSVKAWARSSVRYTGKSRAGEEYAALACNKIYVWGDKSLTPSNRDFIEAHRLKNVCIKGSGHWPMIDQTKEFYRIVGKFISES